MTLKPLVRFIAVGEIRNEFIIDVNGKSSVIPIGGPLIYTAAALKHWGETVGLIGAVGNNYSSDYLHVLKEKGLDIRGIKRAPVDLDLRSFSTFNSKNESVQENPVAVYAACGLTFPRELLGYAYDDEEVRQVKLQEISKLLLENLPPDYLDGLAAHISPLDLTSQIQFSTLFLKGSIRTVTIQPHPAYMNPIYWDDFRVLVKDSFAIITGESELRSLFNGRSTDLFEMMEAVAQFGCKCVIVAQNSKNFYLLDATSSKKYRIPRYPSRINDPTGEIDAFCGAFLSSFQNLYDPVEACVQGSATASIVVEQSGPFTLDECLPGLDRARMDMIRGMISQI